jgi:hypothetical protein
MRVAIAGAVLGSLVLAPRLADACSAAPPRAWFAPANRATIPNNAPALVWSGRDPAGPALPAFDLAVEAEGELWLYRPNKPFVPGVAYTVTFADGSPNSTFTAGPSSPLPATVGTLSVASVKRQKLVVKTSSGSCTNEIDAAVANVTFEPSAELRPWLPVARVTALVDGVVFVAPAYGTVLTPPPAPSTFSETRSLDKIFTSCGATNALDDRGVAEGHHTLTITAHVAGASTDPKPVSIEFDLSCDGQPATSSSADASDTSVAGCACELAQAQLANHAPLGLAAAIVAVGVARRRRTRLDE